MGRFFLAVACSFCLLAAALAPKASRPDARRRAPFRITEDGTTFAVRLDPALARILARDFGAYRLPAAAEEDPQLLTICRERHPETRVTYAVIGDFNGDGLLDAALRLRGRASRFTGAVVAFLTTASGSYEVHVLERGPEWGGGFCLGRVPRGRRIEFLRYRGDEILLDEPGALTLRHDGIELRNPEAWARVYYWDGRRYRHVQTSD